MKLIRNLVLGLAILFGLAIVAMAPAVVHAAPKDTVCTSIGGCASNPNSGASVQQIIKLVINILSIVVGVTAVIMIVVSGFKFMTSAGDPNSVSKARATLMYAAIGLAVAVSAQLITRFVFQ